MLPGALLGSRLGRVGGLKLGCEARGSARCSVGWPGSILASGSTRTSERPACDRLSLSASSRRMSPRAQRAESPRKSTTWRAAKGTKIKFSDRFLSLRDLRESKKNGARTKPTAYAAQRRPRRCGDMRSRARSRGTIANAKYARDSISRSRESGDSFPHIGSAWRGQCAIRTGDRRPRARARTRKCALTSTGSPVAARSHSNQLACAVGFQ